MKCLETERLILRPWQESDAESLYKYAKDPLVGPVAGWPVHTSVEDSRRVIRDVLSAPGTYAVVLRDTGEVVGSIGLMEGAESNLALPENEAEIGYWIGRPFWGQGLIPEAARELMRRAFDDRGVETLWCGWFDGNDKSRRVGEKLGFRHVRSEERHWPLIDKTATQHISRLTKAQWQVRHFMDNLRESFGCEDPGLPIAFWYSDETVAETPKIEGCFFKGMADVRAGRPMSLNADNIGCGGGKFYTGFTPMPAHVPDFVSVKEKYKQTPEMVLDFIAHSEVPAASGKYLNLARIDAIDSFDGIEGVVFFASPDVLSGLATWAFFDNNADDAVTARFGSGCSTIISDAVRENLRSHENPGRGGETSRGGRRTFIGCLDPSVRPHLAPDELSFTIPASRLREMLATMRSSSLFGTPAWRKVRQRIDNHTCR